MRPSVRIAACGALLAVSLDVGSARHDLEQAICGLKEPVLFWLWSRAAGAADASRLADETGVEALSLETRDGRTLRGYRLAAAAQPARGYLLVAQGNAMLADRIVLEFRTFASAGYDVFVFDYRGYGRSEGRRRLRAMLSDYRDIIAELDSRGYASRAFYGLSFGGIVLLDALREDRAEKTLIVDSTPSRLSDHGCPPRHDPVSNVPLHGARMLLIVGGQDRVVSPEMSRELVEQARRAGAEVLRDDGLGHPFMDGQTRRRLAAIRAFLLARILH